MPTARPRRATSDSRCRTADVPGQSIARRPGRHNRRVSTGQILRTAAREDPRAIRGGSRLPARRRPLPAGDPAWVTIRRRVATDSAAPPRTAGAPSGDRPITPDRPRSPDVATPRYGRPRSRPSTPGRLAIAGHVPAIASCRSGTLCRSGVARCREPTRRRGECPARGALRNGRRRAAPSLAASAPSLEERDPRRAPADAD